MTQIRRQCDTHNPAGVLGPQAPEVSEVYLRVEQLDSGLRLSTPQARGWAVLARSRDDLVQGVAEAFREAQLAFYARARGEPYDLDVLSDPSELHPLTASGSRPRADIYDPQDWTRMPDGRWRSPSGRCFRADSQVVQRVLAKRSDETPEGL